MGILVADSCWADTSVLVLTALYLIYWYTTSTFDYWVKKGVPEVKTKEPFFGASRKLIFLQRQTGLHSSDIYKELDGNKFGGYFNLRKPALMVRDPELIKQIMVKDFASFTDNVFIVSEKNDPMFGNSYFYLFYKVFKLTSCLFMIVKIAFKSVTRVKIVLLYKDWN